MICRVIWVQLKNKLALVTGAANGIGAAVAEAYAREGASLILVDRDLEGLERIDDSCKAHGAEVTLVHLDLQESDKIDACDHLQNKGPYPPYAQAPEDQQSCPLW